MADKTDDQIKQDMWKKMADSPFVMIGLTGDHQHSAPMTAQLDPDADGKFWFYTSKDNRIAKGGAAMAQFVAKGHSLFACLAGTLVEETDEAVKDKYWSKQVEAWFEGGRQDPNLLMLRFELGDAEIWESDMSVGGLFKLMTGQTIDPQQAGSHAEVAL
ncbi:pyridoxamine 5'-phosphate oxidase family protein [Sphingomonas donggukensis]|uniref:Pyridoxamine 5'-phosphate oxidase family protein n=1 Tax=Sphingomonas donggukensis TaxID=2949093 RepID=A0ABY4TT49_9SPHN|nr:pyridoxamine 5'-phosphate oxidase family protein [Sphingomonas donggukensis]URW75498.1 pyridoxamine 5'-phosphate oxidase family protein [Sphingomonas donggukensis]